MAIKTITHSLRFNDDDSAYLSRTPGSAGNRKTWTWSGWIKRANVATDNVLFSYYSSGTNYGILRFSDTGILRYFELQTSTVADLQTTAVFRDPSAWYHVVAVVDTTQATSTNRIRVYVNGSQITSFAASTYYSLNFDTDFNRTWPHYIGQLGNSSQYLNGYLTEVHFIDGQALGPETFGEFDANGTWHPKEITGLSYGANGFYLDFSDNSGTTSTTLGKDRAGSNNWTPNNFSITAGLDNDSLTDTPSNNYCVLNSINASDATLSNGNLRVNTTSAGLGGPNGTFGMIAGKWYWEFISGSSNNVAMPGIRNQLASVAQYPGQNANSYGCYQANGNKYYNDSPSGYGSSWAAGDIINVAFDADTGALWFGKNGTWFASGNPAAGTNAAYTGISMLHPWFPAIGDGTGGNATVDNFNFGQRPFAYTPPTGFVALCSANLPDPAIAKPSDHFEILLHTGSAARKNLTSLAFQPDLVWSKNRTASQDHAIFDSVRPRIKGVRPYLSTNATNGDRVMINDYDLDTVFDSPHDNHCTINPLAFGNTAYTTVVSNGNLQIVATTYGSVFSRTYGSTFAVRTGKWYFEVDLITAAGVGNNAIAGWTRSDISNNTSVFGTTRSMIGGQFGFSSGTTTYKYQDSTSSTTITGAATQGGDRVMVAVDFDAGKAWLGKEGQWWNASNTLGAFDVNSPTITFTPTGDWYMPIFEPVGGDTNANRAAMYVNFGQRDFAYTPPSGFKKLSTRNL